MESKFVDSMEEYSRLVARTAIYPRGIISSDDDEISINIGLTYVSEKLAGEAGEFIEKMGKLLRDEGGSGNITDEKRKQLLKELGDILWYIVRASEELGSTIGEVAQMNADKLYDRLEQNKLQGSGDNR